MVDRNFVLKWAHVGLGRRYLQIMEEQRRAAEEHIAEIWDEQERRNAALHTIDHSHIPHLRIAARYAAGGLGLHGADNSMRADCQPPVEV